MSTMVSNKPTQQPPAFSLPGSTAAWVRGVIVAALLALIYWKSIAHYLVHEWMIDANWSHGWLIPVFSLYFLHTRRDELLRCQPRGSYWGAVVLALSLTMYFVAAWRFRMAYPQALSLVTSIFGVTLLLGGWRVMRVVWFPIAFLVLSVPLPDSIYVSLTLPLRKLASSASAAILPLLIDGLHTEAQAVVIDYIMPGKPPGTLNVEEACSGMRLMMAFVTLGVAMAYLGDRPAWQRVIMIACCVPIAVLCNTIRVTTTGYLFILGDAQTPWLEWAGVSSLGALAKGTPHQVLGLLMIGIALGLYALIGYVLNHLVVEVEEKQSPDRA